MAFSKFTNYLTGKEKSRGGFVIGEERVVESLGSSGGDAHGNSRSVEILVDRGAISGGVVERYGREEEGRRVGGGHGGRKGAQDKRMSFQRSA